MQGDDVLVPTCRTGIPCHGCSGADRMSASAAQASGSQHMQGNSLLVLACLISVLGGALLLQLPHILPLLKGP